MWQTHWNPATHWAVPNSSHFRGEKLAGPIGNAYREPGAGLRRRLGGIEGGGAGTRVVPRGPGCKGTEFPEVSSPIPCPALGSTASWCPPLYLGGCPRSRPPEEARPRPGAADRPDTELTLQLLAFVLFGLVFFEQARQHGRVWLVVGTAGPSLRLRELDYALAHPESVT